MVPTKKLSGAYKEIAMTFFYKHNVIKKGKHHKDCRNLDIGSRVWGPHLTPILTAVSSLGHSSHETCISLGFWQGDRGVIMGLEKGHPWSQEQLKKFQGELMGEPLIRKFTCGSDLRGSKCPISDQPGRHWECRIVILSPFLLQHPLKLKIYIYTSCSFKLLTLSLLKKFPSIIKAGSHRHTEETVDLWWVK